MTRNMVLGALVLLMVAAACETSPEEIVRRGAESAVETAAAEGRRVAETQAVRLRETAEAEVAERADELREAAGL